MLKVYRKFNRAMWIFSVFVILFLSACSTINGSTSLKVGDPAPYTKFTKLDGTGFVLTDELKGKTAIIIFWASWCNRSRPALVRINDFVRDKLHKDNVVVIAPSIDKSSDYQKLLDTIKYQSIDTAIIAYSGNDIYDEAYMAFDADTLPGVFIIDPNGNIAAMAHSDSIVYDYFAKK